MDTARAQKQNETAAAPAPAANSSLPKKMQKHTAESAGLPLFLQAQLTMGAIDDPQEKEADAVAAQVMRSPKGELTTCHGECDTEEVQALVQPSPATAGRTASSGVASSKLETDINSQQGQGTALPDKTREFMELRMGSDFSHVRVHNSGEANSLNHKISSRAFTVGNDIFFADGHYHPEHDEGRRLLAHELTHVMQQTNVRRKHNDDSPVNVRQTVQRIQRDTLQDEVDKELGAWAKKSKKTTDPKNRQYAFDLQEYAWTLINDPDTLGPIPEPKSKKAHKIWEKKFKKATLLAKMILKGGKNVEQKDERAALILNLVAQAGFGTEAVDITASMTDIEQIEYVYQGVLDKVRKADPAVLTKITQFYITKKGQKDNFIIEKFVTSDGSFEKSLRNAQITAMLKPLIAAYEKEPFLIDLISQALLRKKPYRKVFSDWMWKEGKGEFLFKVLQSKYFIEPEYSPTVVADVGKLKLEQDMPWVYANKQKYYVSYLVQMGKDAGVKINPPKNLKFYTIKTWLDNNTENIGEALAKKYPNDPDKWIKTYEEITDIFFYHVSGRNINPDRAGKLSKLGAGAPVKMRLKADCDVFSTYAMRFFNSVKDPDNPAFKAFEPIGYMAIDPKGDEGHSVALMRRDGNYYVINNKEVS